ncbi:MAG: protein kinase [Planctomycetes bacterium]|nr:protein kinase [Planctomycetota bacterium]
MLVTRHVAAISAGDRVGPFEIERRLGGGGMGQVFLARDARLDRKVAVKLLHRDVTNDHGRLRRFEKEARAASALNHPNIITIFEIGDSDFGRYIAMEHVEGQTLRRHTGEPSPLEFVSDVGRQLAEALSVAHAAGIVHRDIKPDNVMVRDDGYVKLLDFGLVRLAPSEAPLAADKKTDCVNMPTVTAPGMLLGTIAYMSPEQAQGAAIGTASDVFSLGIVLYELATGRHPFTGDSQIEILQAITKKSPLAPRSLNPSIPPAMESMLLATLNKNPSMRPSADELRSMFGQVAQDLQPRTLPPRERPHRVGRGKELAELQTALEGVVDGNGILYCVSGDAGLGKSSLVEDFFEHINQSATSCHTARGRCSERLAGAEAYLPIFEILDDLLHGDHGDEASRALRAIAPTWYIHVAPHPSDDESSRSLISDAQVASQERMKRELLAFFQELTRVRPLVVSLDDLHWVDLATLDVLSFLTTRIRSLRLLFVVTYRPSELLLAEHPFLPFKKDSEARGLCKEIALDLLTIEDLTSYIALEFPDHRFPKAFVELIHDRTGGNPLFMADLLRYLRDKKLLGRQDGHWHVNGELSDLERDLPPSIRSMIERKLDRLSKADWRLLVTASVQGHVFDAAAIAIALGREAADVEEHLEEVAQTHRLIRADAERDFPNGAITMRYSFVHVLYQNTLYELLAPSRRVALCRSVAEALITLHAEKTDSIASELALLFESARDFARAADLFIQAAVNAGRLYATKEVVRLSNRAIQNADQLDGDERSKRVFKAAVGLAQSHLTLAQFNDAVAAYDQAETAADDCGDQEGVVQAICGRAFALLNTRDLKRMRDEGHRAMGIATRQESALGQACAEMVLGIERQCCGDIDASLEHVDRAVPVFERDGLPTQAIEAMTYRVAMHVWQLEYAEAERVFQWVYERAKEVGSCFFVAGNLFFRGISLGNQGRVAESLECLHEGLRLAELNDEHYWQPRIPNTIGWIHREFEDHDAAIKWDTDNIAISRELEWPEAEANARVNLAHGHLLLDEPDTAMEHLQKAREIYDTDIWYRWRYNLRMQAEYARYWILKGNLKAATTHATECLSEAERTRSRKYIAVGNALLAEIATLHGEVDEAHRLFCAALDVFKKYPCPTVEWRILTRAGDLAKQRGKCDEAGELHGQARSVVHALADSVSDGKLRDRLLKSKAVTLLGGS